MKKVFLVLLCGLLSLHSVNAVSWKNAKKYGKPATKFVLASLCAYTAGALYCRMAETTSEAAGSFYFACKLSDSRLGSTAIKHSVEGLFKAAVLGSGFVAMCVASGLFVYSYNEDCKQIQNEQ